MIPNPAPAWWPEHLEVADKTVVVEGLDPFIQLFLAAAAARHWTMFLKPLIVTSGKDSIHALGSKHNVGKAVDIRSRDLDQDEQDQFAVSMIELQATAKVGIFDERFIGTPHWHVETA